MGQVQDATAEYRKAVHLDPEVSGEHILVGDER